MADNENCDFRQYVPFKKYIHEGKWDDAKQFIRDNAEAKRAKISHRGSTALHIAIFSGHTNIVEELVKIMTKEDLEIKDRDGVTVLASCAIFGNVKMAECIIKQNQDLLSIENKSDKLIPVVLAITDNSNAIEMVRYLYKETPPEYLDPTNGHNGATFVTRCIFAKAFDLALDLLKLHPALAIAKDFMDQAPVEALASLSFAYPSGNQLTFWKQWIYNSICIVPAYEKGKSGEEGYIESGCKIKCLQCVCLLKVSSPLTSNRNSATATNQTSINIQESENIKSGEEGSIKSARGFFWNLLKPFGIQQIYELKLLHHQANELLVHMCKELPGLSHKELENGHVFKAIIKAVKKGIPEFVTAILEACPELVWSTEQSSRRNLFMLAVLHRQNEVFRCLSKFSAKNSILIDADKNYNTILHIAAMFESSARRNNVRGAAFLMQREVQWYKAVEKVVHPSLLESRNKKGHIPRELFTKSHIHLLKEGEKWMKETSTSCTVVAALIVTIMFAAAITFPGGNDEGTGFPTFLKKNLFKIFIIFDAVSLLSASTSLLMFLGILTSRYAEEDFLKSLPIKMIIGFFTLILSIATMMTTFCAALFLILPGRSKIVIPVVCLASVPVALFARMQFRLLYDMVITTYGPGILDRKVKRS